MGAEKKACGEDPMGMCAPEDAGFPGIKCRAQATYGKDGTKAPTSLSISNWKGAQKNLP